MLARFLDDLIYFLLFLFGKVLKKGYFSSPFPPCVVQCMLPAMCAHRGLSVRREVLAGAGCKHENWNELLYQTLPKYNPQSTPIFKSLTHMTGGGEFTLRALWIESLSVQLLPELRGARISDKDKDVNSENKYNSFDLELKSHGAQ